LKGHRRLLSRRAAGTQETTLVFRGLHCVYSRLTRARGVSRYCPVECDFASLNSLNRLLESMMFPNHNSIDQKLSRLFKSQASYRAYEQCNALTLFYHKTGIQGTITAYCYTIHLRYWTTRCLGRACYLACCLSTMIFVCPAQRGRSL